MSREGDGLSPHPLTLARDQAEAERARLAGAYSSMRATWGQLGGLTTFYRYGALSSVHRACEQREEERTVFRAPDAADVEMWAGNRGLGRETRNRTRKPPRLP